MKILWIGDMHLRLSDLGEVDSIMNQLLTIIDQEKPSYAILAGDQFDSFAVVRSEILAKWTRFFNEASKLTKVIALVGNHDMSGADGGVSAMEPFKSYPNVLIVDQEMAMPDLGLAFTPFIRSTEDFEKSCRAIPAGYILFCHQSFNGAQFENGFYDPHGADVSCVKHLNTVISGHVHKSQIIENIFYPGTPRQLTFSDAGETKAVYSLSLSNGSYTIDKAHVLDVPKFVVWQGESIEKLLWMVETSLKTTVEHTFKNVHVKFSAKGTPSEISQFWENASVIEFKSKAKRIVDALTSMKPVTAFITVKGLTQNERLSEYIKQRTWRTDADQLARRAREYLTS